MTTERDVIKELHFFLYAGLPLPALKAWLGSLSPGQLQEVEGYVNEAVQQGSEIMGPVVEAFRQLGRELMEELALLAERMSDLWGKGG